MKQIENINNSNANDLDCHQKQRDNCLKNQEILKEEYNKLHSKLHDAKHNKLKYEQAKRIIQLGNKVLKFIIISLIFSILVSAVPLVSLKLVSFLISIKSFVKAGHLLMEQKKQETMFQDFFSVVLPPNISISKCDEEIEKNECLRQALEEELTEVYDKRVALRNELIALNNKISEPENQEEPYEINANNLIDIFNEIPSSEITNEGKQEEYSDIIDSPEQKKYLRK